MNTKIEFVLVSGVADYFLEQALISVYSARMHNPDAIIELVVDTETGLTLTGSRAAIMKYVSLVTIVEVPEVFNSNTHKSRYLKTSLRQIVKGDFLFIDCDTVICGSLEKVDDFKGDICMVADLNGELLLSDQHILERCEMAGFGNLECKPYFNSGVIFARDSQTVHNFYSTWFSYWQHSSNAGVIYDQPALCCTNVELGNPIVEISGIWNCQFKMKGFPYLKKSKILHYYANNGNSELPFHIKEIFDRVKRIGDVDEHIIHLLKKPRTVFYSLLDMNPDKAFDLLSTDMVYHYYVHPRLFGLVSRLMSKF